MAGIEEVVERLARDAAFRARLLRDPATALAGYLLYDEDLAVLADHLDGDPAVGVASRSAPDTLAWLTAALLDIRDTSAIDDGTATDG